MNPAMFAYGANVGALPRNDRLSMLLMGLGDVMQGGNAANTMGMASMMAAGQDARRREAESAKLMGEYFGSMIPEQVNPLDRTQIDPVGSGDFRGSRRGSIDAQDPRRGAFPTGPSNPGTDRYAKIRASLGHTESGNNYGAQNKEGYVGKYQFGSDRLSDYNRANGTSYSLAQFKANPELQERVFDWHMADIDRFIVQNGLHKVIGQEIGGVPMTIDGMRAMAHLGGKGGLRGFISSGGRSNPADSNGTSLAAYAATHGAGGSVTSQLPKDRMAAIMASPNVSQAAKMMMLDRLVPDPMQQAQLRKMNAEIANLEGDSSTEAEREISRLEALGIPKDVATKIKEGVARLATDPVTGAHTVIDMSTGQPLYQAVGDQAEQVPPPSAPQYGNQYPNARDAFGLEGVVKGGVNALADMAGANVPFADVQQSQSDFGVLREKLINDIASGYNRQPPSWLLKNIEALTPQAGSLMGPEQAQSKLRAIGRDLSNELREQQRQLNRPMREQARQEIEARISGLAAAVNRIDSALMAFQERGGKNRTKSGVSWSVVE